MKTHRLWLALFVAGCTAAGAASLTVPQDDDSIAPPSGVHEVTGEVSATEGVDLATTGSQPTCDGTNTGRLWWTDNSGASDDAFEVCIQESGSTFAWTDGLAAGGGGAHASTHSENQSDEVFVENLGATSVDVSTALRPDGSGGLSFTDVSHGDLTGVTSDQHHAQTHASAHSDGGADEVTIENLAATSTTATECLQPDGSGGVEFNACPGAGSIDGSGTADQYSYFTDSDTVTSGAQLQRDATGVGAGVAPQAILHASTVTTQTDADLLDSLQDPPLLLTTDFGTASNTNMMRFIVANTSNAVGMGQNYVRVRGTLAAPTAPSDNDDIVDKNYFTGTAAGETLRGTHKVRFDSGNSSVDYIWQTGGTTAWSILGTGATEWEGQAAPAASASGNGTLYFDSTANDLYISEHAGGYQAVVSAPTTHTDNAIPTYDGAAGGGLQDTAVTIDDNDTASFQGIVVEQDSFTSATNAIGSSGTYMLLCDTTSNTVELDLPAAATVGAGYSLVVKVIDATNTCNVDPNSTETIDGSSTTVALTTLYEILSIVSDGTNWLKVGSGVP